MKKGKPGDAKMGTKVVAYIFLIIALVISLFPFYMMFVSSTLKTGEILGIPPKLTIGNNLINNINNLKEKINIGKVIFNSLFISIIYTVLTLILNSMAGYALAKYNLDRKSTRLNSSH